MVLSDDVLPLIRTRSDLHRWSAANAHGRDMHEAVDILEAAVGVTDPVQVYSVTHRALTSAVKVIARADDSSGIIGDACRRLLELHPRVAAAAAVSPTKLVEWMVKFQFDGEVDYFELDPVDYAPALGGTGVTTYREKLREIETRLGPRPADRWESPHSHEWWVLDWNARRLAVLDHDIDAIIRTHAKDMKVAAWLEDTARAFEEVGEFDLAVDWAKKATDFDGGHQSLKAADYWCSLLEEHHPVQARQARLDVFRRWPSSTTAARLHQQAREDWPDLHDEVLSTLAASPRDAVMFALMTLKDPAFAWHLAHSLSLESADLWSELIKSYEKIDPLAVLPIHQRLVERQLTDANANNYRLAARRLVKMSELAQGSEKATEVDEFIAHLREVHRRRPRLQQEFDRAGLLRFD